MAARAGVRNRNTQHADRNAGGRGRQISRGEHARLLPSPVSPAVLPRWDDSCCVVLSVAEQLCQLRLRHSWSEPDDKTGPGTTDPETAEVLNTLGLTSAGAWTNAATPVLWRTAPKEMRPPTEQEFSAQVDLAVADIPDDIRDQIKSTYAAHDVPVVRNHQLDWVFFLNWRWGDGWLRNESHGSLLGGGSCPPSPAGQGGCGGANDRNLKASFVVSRMLGYHSLSPRRRLCCASVSRALTTKHHRNIAANILRKLNRQLLEIGSRPNFSNTGVGTSTPTIRFADLVVDCGSETNR